MRAIPLFIAITLIGCVMATPAEVQKKPQTPQHDLRAVVHKAGEALSKIQLKSPFSFAAMPQEVHAFQAEQTIGACDTTAYQEALTRALQGCPDLAKLMVGQITAASFLPTFCNSACHSALIAQMPAIEKCSQVSSTARQLSSYVTGCAQRPRCFNEPLLKGMDTLEKRCKYEIDVIADFKNYTVAGINGTRAACQGTCVTEAAALLRSYPECFTNDNDKAMPALAMANLMEGLCQKENGEYCGVRMKAIGRLSCSDSSVCSGSLASESWCTSNGGYWWSSCTVSVTEARLATFCGSCVANLQKNAAAFEDEADVVVSSLNLYCGTVNGGAYVANGTNPFCYPAAMAAYGTLSGVYAPSNATVAALCTGNASKCVERVVGLSADIATSKAKTSFVSCLYGYSAGSSYCLSNYESSLRSAADMRNDAGLICAQNAKKDWCLAKVYEVTSASSTCDWYTSYYSSSTLAAYRAQLNATITSAGCCMSYYNDYRRYDSSNYAASYLAPGQRLQPYYYSSTQIRYYNFTHNSLYNREVVYRNQQPANDLFTCLTASANSTSFWDQVEQTCGPTLASPANASIPVMISWSRVKRSNVVKVAIEAGLRVDVAVVMGVKVSSILRGVLIENPKVTIYLRNESTLTRRQSSTTDSGATYTFQVDQDTAAESTAAVARLNSAISAGTFTTPSAAAAVTTQCAECMDSRSDSLLKGAESPTTPAPPGSGGSVGSSARAVAVASAIVAALALAMTM